jgi:hypothetical protein
MEFKTIMQALVKDIAEQLRPMVADMVRQELTVCQPDMAVIAQNIDLDVVAGHINLALLAEVLTTGQLSDIARDVDLSQLVNYISMTELAGGLTDDQLAEIAGEVDLHELAGKLDAEKIAEDIDLDHAIGEWFSNQSFTIRTN